MVNFPGKHSTTAAVVLVLALGVTAGCATKGYVKKEVAAARGYTDEQVAIAKARADEAWTKASVAEGLRSATSSEVTTQQVQFAFDDFKLMPEAQGLLDQLGAQLASHPHYGLGARGG